MGKHHQGGEVSQEVASAGTVLDGPGALGGGRNTPYRPWRESAVPKLMWGLTRGGGRVYASLEPEPKMEIPGEKIKERQMWSGRCIVEC
jgi:hypothetical protein